jgi:hypothetical protein
VGGVDAVAERAGEEAMSDVSVTTRHGLTHCPGCSAALDASSGAAPPAPGDVTLRAYCGILMVFTDDLCLRLATQADLDALTEEEREAVKMMGRAIEMATRTKGQA